MNAHPILEIRGLRTVFGPPARQVTVIHDVDLHVNLGETLALVGESGSGKSVTSLSIMGLLTRGVGTIAAGKVLLRTKGGPIVDLVQLEKEAIRRIRGNDIGMVFQEPMTSLNPVYTIGDQIGEALRVHQGASRKEALETSITLLNQAGIPDARRRAGQYPHELSGGMRQRATIAMALICDPVLLIADEPTTALDVTIQAQILDLLRQLQQKRGMAMLFITHNLGVVAEIAQRVAVMYAGRIVESGPVREVFRTPRHPYTIGLLRSQPRLGEATRMKQRDAKLITIPGIVPSLANLPQGCTFAPRCSFAQEDCRAAVPPLAAINKQHYSRCIRWKEITA
ncbi:ABC transporter ATP-binding protein [Bartonella sp. DGB2]|uniref:ABC transporter ATP-binding protein n=1 Tax=Bartonella sp. DGB2 TaxID=3388426 RepID=UPI00398FE89D